MCVAVVRKNKQIVGKTAPGQSAPSVVCNPGQSAPGKFVDTDNRHPIKL